MERIPVLSSQIRSIGFDETEQLLEVQFASGGIYVYRKVPYLTYRSLLAAKSKGAYLAEFIIGDRKNPLYKYECIFQPEKKTKEEKDGQDGKNQKEERKDPAPASKSVERRKAAQHKPAKRIS